jgi:Flp pilus assembly protein TadG
MTLMTRPSSAWRRRLERGQFSWVTFVLLSALVGGTYLAIVWVPVYVVHHEVKQVVRAFMNRAVKDRNDQRIVAALCQKLATLDTTLEVDASGRTTKVPTVDVSPSDVTWERDTSSSPPMLHVAFEYVRVVRYPLLDLTDERVMSVDFNEDIEIPKWGPSP